MITIVLTVVLFATTISLNQFCKTFDEFRVEASQFDSFSDSAFFPKEITTNIKNCLHGDGDLQKALAEDINIESLS